MPVDVRPGDAGRAVIRPLPRCRRHAKPRGRHALSFAHDPERAEAKARALASVIAESDADPRTVPHEAFRVWLLRLAQGEFDASGPRYASNSIFS